MWTVSEGGQSDGDPCAETWQRSPVSPRFDLSPFELETPRGPRRAIVATPARHMRLSLDDLSQRRVESDQTDDEFARALRLSPDARLMIFRGRDESGAGSWGVAEDASESEAADLGELMVRRYLPIWRSLAASGLVLLVHLELDERTREGLEAGRRIVMRELRLKSRTEGTLADEVEEALTRLDLWILKHLTFFFGLSFERATRTTLPDMMPMLEQRDVSLRRLLAGVPVSSLVPPTMT